MDRAGVRALAVVAAAALAFTTARAQDSTVVVGSVVSATTSVAIPYATFSFSPGSIRRFTNAQGGFSVRLKSREAYKLGIRQVGYAPLDTTVTLGSGRTGIKLLLQLHPVAYRLGAVRTITSRVCSDRDDGGDIGGIIDEITKNAEREIVLRESYPFQYQMERMNRYEGSPSASRRDTAFFFSTDRDPYRLGRVVRERLSAAGNEREMRIPQLVDLTNESFLLHHCFFYGGIRREGRSAVYVIDFEPRPDVRSADVSGTVLLDTATLRIRRATFALTRAEDIVPRIRRLEVTTTYRDLFPGVELFDEINSTETFERERPTDQVPRHVERQRLLGVKFLKVSPQDVDSSALVAEASQPLPDERVVARVHPAPATDSNAARAAIATTMESDLRTAGFYDRKQRFTHAVFLDLAEVEKRIQNDSTNLVPEIFLIRVGASPAVASGPHMGLSVSAERCTINLYVNGKPSHVPITEVAITEAAGVRRARLAFGPELPVSRIGAIEVYPGSSAAPREFVKDYPGCGLVLLWTRPELSFKK